MLQYISRKKTLLNDLRKAMGSDLPSDFKGYMLLRDCKLPEKAWDTIDTWTHGEYDYDLISTNLRKLDRPVPGRGGVTHLTGLSGFQEEGEAAPTYYGSGGGPSDESGGMASFVFMAESLFLLPENFDDDELLDEVAQYIDNVDILYVAGDLADNLWLEEDEAVSILANYGQVRNYLHKKVLGRGYNRPSRPATRTPPPPRAASGQRRPRANNMARPKKWSKKFLISRSICARCGKKGHWARECTNPPGERQDEVCESFHDD